jgi:hypothetical protein
MRRLPLITSFSVAIFAGAISADAMAADNNADKIYKYPPYSQQSQSGNGNTQAPENDRGPPPAARTYDRYPDANEERDDDPVYRGDARGVPSGSENDGNGDVVADGPQSREAVGPPPSRFRELSLVEATASAPDRSIPYDVRKHDARRAAIEAWRSKVAEQYGPEFSRWRMAARKRVDCRPERGDDVVCSVSGVPVRGQGRVGRAHQDGRY